MVGMWMEGDTGSFLRECQGVAYELVERKLLRAV